MAKIGQKGVRILTPMYFFDNGHFYYTHGLPEYRYDANGNLTQDVNKEIPKIAYNELNLPTSIDFTGNYKIEYNR